MSLTRTMSMAAFAAAILADNPGLQEAMRFVDRDHRSPWRTKLHNRHISVAAMKRHARKRRNIRARSSKRRA